MAWRTAASRLPTCRWQPPSPARIAPALTSCRAAPPLPCSPAQKSANYDEARVQRLRHAQEQAAAHLAAGVPPPVEGTSIFPPGGGGYFVEQVRWLLASGIGCGPVHSPPPAPYPPPHPHPPPPQATRTGRAWGLGRPPRALWPRSWLSRSTGAPALAVSACAAGQPLPRGGSPPQERLAPGACLPPYPACPVCLYTIKSNQKIHTLQGGVPRTDAGQPAGGARPRPWQQARPGRRRCCRAAAPAAPAVPCAHPTAANPHVCRTGVC